MTSDAARTTQKARTVKVLMTDVERVKYTSSTEENQNIFTRKAFEKMKNGKAAKNMKFREESSGRLMRDTEAFWEEMLERDGEKC